MKVWKLVSGIISLVLVLIIIFQSCAVGISNAMSKSDDASGAVGILVAILLIAAGVVSIVVRKSVNKKTYIPLIVLYGLATLIGIVGAGNYSDLTVWSVWCFVCCMIAVIGMVKCIKPELILHKKWWFWIWVVGITIVSIAMLFIPSKSDNIKNGSKQISKKEAKEAVLVPEKELDYVYSTPEKYVGKRVIIKGKVSDSVKKSKDGMTFDIYADPNSLNKNSTIYYDKLDINVKDEDYVIIDGIVLGEEDVDDLNLSDVNIKATKITKSNYIEVCSPTIRTYKINKTINQKGYKVILKKVELAKNQTRAYVTVKNSGSGEFDLYDSSAKLIQGHKQYDPDTDFDANYPDFPDTIDKGVKAKGVISFPKIKNNKSFTLKIPASSDNYEEDIKDYVFNVHVK